MHRCAQLHERRFPPDRLRLVCPVASLFHFNNTSYTPHRGLRPTSSKGKNNNKTSWRLAAACNSGPSLRQLPGRPRRCRLHWSLPIPVAPSADSSPDSSLRLALGTWARLRLALFLAAPHRPLSASITGPLTLCGQFPPPPQKPVPSRLPSSLDLYQELLPVGRTLLDGAYEFSFLETKPVRPGIWIRQARASPLL